jgi:hypothetical protein
MVSTYKEDGLRVTKVYKKGPHARALPTICPQWQSAVAGSSISAVFVIVRGRRGGVGHKCAQKCIFAKMFGVDQKNLDPFAVVSCCARAFRCSVRCCGCAFDRSQLLRVRFTFLFVTTSRVGFCLQKAHFRHYRRSLKKKIGRALLDHLANCFFLGGGGGGGGGLWTQNL